MRLLVVSETHFVRGADGRICSCFGVDGYPFWQRYLDVFDDVIVAARTAQARGADGFVAVEGPGVTVAPLPDYRGPWGYAAQRRRLRRAMRTAIAGADALCLRAPGPIAMCAWRLGRQRPFAVEVVGDPHDALAPGAVRSALRPLARTLATHGLRTLCREAVAVAYVTGATLRERYPARSWSTSYTSIDLGEDAFATDEQIAARRQRWTRSGKGTERDPWRLVCIGTFAQLYKGQDVLIDAVARCRARATHVELTLVGDGIHRAALERRTECDGLCSVVRFTGQVPSGAGVRAMLDAADVFVLPSRAEGLPRALLEAMAWGVPSIASRAGGTPELLPPDRLVAPGDAADLADTLTQLCRPPTDVAALAVTDRSVARRFAASVVRPRRLELYRRLRTAAAAQSLGRPRRRLSEACAAG